jgi:hypothetical protein
MAALGDNFHGWRPVRGSPLFASKQPCAAAATFFRGAICTGATGVGKIKVSNGVTTDVAFGVVTERVTTTAADQLVEVLSRGIVWFTGVAAIAHASNRELLYPLLTSDNPADLTATAAGNCGALGRVLQIEVTAVSGYLDLSDQALQNNVT